MSLHPPEHPSDLSRLQRQYLRNARAFCASPPTLGRLIAKSWFAFVSNVAIFAAGVVLCLAAERPIMVLFVAGMSFGVLCRDLGYLRRSVMLWPVIAVVTDRQKLDELLGEPLTPSESDPGRP